MKVSQNLDGRMTSPNHTVKCIILGGVQAFWPFMSCYNLKEKAEKIGLKYHLSGISSVQLLSRVRLFATPWIAARQASLSITNSRSSPRLTSIESVMPSSHLIFGHKVAKVLEFQLQHHSFQRNPRADLLQNGLVGSPCSPRDSQESSPTPQFKSINYLTLSLFHSPTLTSIHDHRKNHSLD